MLLSNIKINKPYKVIDLKFEGPIKQRFLDLGFTNGTIINILNKIPLKDDPIIVKIKDTRLAIRKEDANKIEVI